MERREHPQLRRCRGRHCAQDCQLQAARELVSLHRGYEKCIREGIVLYSTQSDLVGITPPIHYFTPQAFELPKSADP